MIGGRWIAIAGDLHGELPRLDKLLRRFERATRGKVALVLQVGDLELGPDARPLRGIEMVSIGGNHDATTEVAPGFTSLGRAGVVERLGLRIGGLSGTYHPRLSEEPGPARTGEHCTRDDVALLLAAKVDVLLLHEWPENLQPGTRGNPHARLLIERLEPRWAFCGHRHAAFSGEIGQTRVRCLADVPKGGADAVAFLLLPDLVEAAPLEELETFRSFGDERGNR